MTEQIKRVLLLCLIISVTYGCYFMRGSSGGGETAFEPPRKVNASDIALTEGYRIEPVAAGLTFPTGVAFDDSGGVYIAESGYSYGEVWTTPRLLRIEPDGRTVTIAEGGKNGPWTGLAFYQGAFFVAEGGVLEGGRILRIAPDGGITVLTDGLPSKGDHHTNGPVIGPDGWLYFAQGVVTNSAVVGEDNLKFGWLKRNPEFHDIACTDVTLTGKNYKTRNFLKEGSAEEVETGAFVPFGTRTEKGQVIRGRVPCSGAIMRILPDSSDAAPELVAWGFRNPFSLSFSPEGRLYATDNMYDARGSRPVFGAGDVLWEVKQGAWYGWPDFHAGKPLDEHDRYKPQGGKTPELLLEKTPGEIPKPVTVFAVHSSSNGVDFSRGPGFGYPGQAFVAQFGDEAPVTGKVLSPVGFKVVRVDISSGTINDFAVNKGKTNGPASWLGSGGLERPVAARFNPDGSALYVVDFGVMLHDESGAKPIKKTGVLWRIVRSGPARETPG
jgi:glucose/arabinose dehydrogenase